MLKELWRLIIHMPVGMFNGALVVFGIWMAITFPPVGVPVAILLGVSVWSFWRAFRTYEKWQDDCKKDGAYYDIVGYPWGFALSMIMGIIFLVGWVI